MRSRNESGATMGIAGPCIVDLSGSSEEDGDDDVVFLAEYPAPLLHSASSRKVQSVVFGVEVNTDIVILEDVDNSIELRFGAGRVEKDSQNSSQNSSVVLDDDCCILDEDPSKEGMVKTHCDNDSDDLVMTGEVGQVACRDFPHARHLCVQFPFQTTAHTDFCSQCHCYVCDMLAPCSLWGDGTRLGDHCHASDKVGERWKLLRQYNKSHPTGCSDPSTIQQLLSPGNSSAGNSESTSLTELLGCHTGGCASSQYPLQISLNRTNRGVSSHSRRHHSHGVSMQSKVQRYVHRRVPRCPLTYCSSYRGDGDGDCHSRRVHRKSSSSYAHHLRTSNLGSIQRAQEAFAVVLGRQIASTISAEKETLGGVLPDANPFLCKDVVGELATSQTVRPSSNPDRMDELGGQQYLNAERASVCPDLDSGSATPLPQNDANRYSHIDPAVGMRSPLLAESKSNGRSENTVEGGTNFLTTSPPVLLADYLLNGDDFWDYEESFL